MRGWAPIAASLLMAALATLAAGCGEGPTAAPTTPRATAHTALDADYRSADDQYRRMRTGLTLPRNIVFPGHLRETSARYPLDAGTVAAQNYWLCAWLQAYAAGKNQRTRALAQLPKYLRMDAYTQALDAPGRSVIDTMIRDARAGRAKAAVAFTRASCGGPFYGRSGGS